MYSCILYSALTCIALYSCIALEGLDPMRVRCISNHGRCPLADWRQWPMGIGHCCCINRIHRTRVGSRPSRAIQLKQRYTALYSIQLYTSLYSIQPLHHPSAMPSMRHLSRVSKDNEHAMHLHRVAPGSSKLTGNAGDFPQLPGVQAPPPPGPGTTRSARRLAALHRAYYLLTYLSHPTRREVTSHPTWCARQQWACGGAAA